MQTRVPVFADGEPLLFRYNGLSGRKAECMLRVFADRASGSTVFIATEIPSNPGASVTNNAERLWEQVVQTFDIKRLSGAVFVERYLRPQGEPDTYDLVSFSVHAEPARASLVDPRWTRMGLADFSEIGLPFPPIEQGVE